MYGCKYMIYTYKVGVKKIKKQNKTKKQNLNGGVTNKNIPVYYYNNLVLRDFLCSQHQSLRIYNRHDAVQRQ